MSDITIGQVLAQMRATAAVAAGEPDVARSPGSIGGTNGLGNFGDALGAALASVDAGSKQASAMADAFTRGESGADLGQVMVGLEKASLAFEAVNQTRNRLLTAYRDIMNMPL